MQWYWVRLTLQNGKDEFEDSEGAEPFTGLTALEDLAFTQAAVCQIFQC